MADNKLLLKRASEEDFLSEDDPLAELSRLVGFDPAPVAKAAHSPQRREPAFDLEDELLKELEIYAQPVGAEAQANANTNALPAYVPVDELEPEPQVAPAVEIEAYAPASVAEDAVESIPEPAVHQPVILESIETYSDASGEHVYERPASHPVFDLEDEILREFSAFDARRVEHSEEHPVAAELVHQDAPQIEFEAESPPAELYDVPESQAVFAATDHGRDIYESFRDDDLDAAISNAFAPEVTEPASEPVAAEVAEPQPETLSVAALEPLDDSFWSSTGADAEAAAADVVPVTSIVEVEETPVAQSALLEPWAEEYVEQEQELVSQDFTDAMPVPSDAGDSEPIGQPEESVLFAVVRRGARTAPPAPQEQDHGPDELLADVEKYPVVDNAARWSVHSKPVAAEDVARSAPPVVQDFEPRQIADPVAEGVAAPVELAAEPVIDESSFDIDLGDIEFDLSDLNEGIVTASPDLLADLADETVVTAPQPAVVPPVQASDSDYSSLPFDPSQIAQEDETFEAIAEMDVPDVPVVHEEEKPAPHPEYDIDLDAEMAQLFVNATSQASTTQRVAQLNDGSIALDGATPRQPAGLDLDDFERALEEDFRRSFAENRTSSTPDRVSLAPVHAEERSGRSGRSWALLASAAVAIVVFGGAGVYAFMTGDTKMLASSEPKVILADTDPVKVVPDDPGGKQVPNQNKAVYDRVAGEKVDRAKQESLVTSNEEPVDVVQRTLMPETLPMDDDTLAAATPTGDTIDPRLLPDEEEADRVSTTNKVVSGVSPRKVKTMVVRPDGSLVERDVTDADLKQQATNDAELMKIAQKAAQDAATASDSQEDEIAKAIDSVPERLTASSDTAAKPTDVAEGKSARPEELKPAITAETKVAEVPPVQPVVIEDEQPAVAEQPTTEPSTTDTASSEAKPEAVATEQKPVETIAEEPLERSITTNDAANATASAAEEEAADAPVRKVKTTTITPVPEVRPVEQPVDIVGTVDEQGSVRADTKEKTQDVALADPVEKPAETTAVPAGTYVIQIASLPSEAEAQTSYSRLSAKFPGIIGGKGVDIRRAEIKNKGTYYRVRIPAGTKQEAQALCSEYKAAGGSCLVSK